MSDGKQEIYGLIGAAVKQQAAVQAALEGLAAERAALEREREQLALTVRTLGPSARATVQDAVAASLSEAAGTATETVQVAARQLQGRLDDVGREAREAESALRRVVRWASWRLLGWITVVAGMMVLLGWLASGAVLWWDTGAIVTAQARKAELQAQVAELADTYDAWVKAGALQKLIQCGSKRRWCVRVDESAGSFEGNGHADYRVIQGY